MQKTLVFSIAINGYQWLYRDCIASHNRYAEVKGYHYQVVTRPHISAIGVECCWLKLTLMLAALKAGYETVLFVDADAYINAQTPDLHTVLSPSHYLYLAKSYSQRYNSGVILVKNHPQLRAWLQKVISHRHSTIKPENDVGGGENGHIIQYAKNCDFVTTLNRRWNNTYDPQLLDYIRHFSFGPLRQSVYLNLSHKLLARLTKGIVKLRHYSQWHKSPTAIKDPLLVLTTQVLKHYQCFSQR